jgi:hypothetical protein
MTRREVRKGKDVREGMVRSRVLCLERVRVVRGLRLRSTHGRSLDWSEFSRVHDAREKQTQKVAENERNGEMLRKQKAEKRKRILSVISE